MKSADLESEEDWGCTQVEANSVGIDHQGGRDPGSLVVEDPAMASITMSLDDVGNFSKLLMALEESQDRLGVVDYALGMSSLEDVFMALGEETEQTDSASGSTPGGPELGTTASAERTESSEWRCAKAVFILRLKPIQASRFRLMTVLFLPILIQLGATFLAGLGAEDNNSGSNGYAIAVYPAMSFGFVLISSCQDILLDIKNKCKYVAISQGLPARAYWLGNFLAHVLLLLPAAIEFVIVFLLMRPPSIPVASIPIAIVCILLYPIPLTLCVYNFTAALAGSESVSKVVPVMLMATQLLPALITWILTAPFMQNMLEGFGIAWHITLSVLNPNYAMPGMMAYLVNVDGPLKLSAGEHWISMSALPLYMMFVTSTFLLLNLIRLDAGLDVTPEKIGIYVTSTIAKLLSLKHPAVSMVRLSFNIHRNMGGFDFLRNDTYVDKFRVQTG